MTSHSIYTQRRATLAAQLGPGGIAIIPTALEQQRNRDSDFLFRHDSYFYYLTGFTEPKAWLVITGDGPKGPKGPTTILFCQPKDLEREIWDGIRLGPDAAPSVLGASSAALLATMIQARVDTDAPLATGQTAIMRLVRSLSSMTDARGDMVRVHADLLKVGQERADYSLDPNGCPKGSALSSDQSGLKLVA